MPRQPLLGRRVSTVLRHPPVQRCLSIHIAGQCAAVHHSCAALGIHIHAAAGQRDGRWRDGRRRDGTTALTTTRLGDSRKTRFRQTPARLRMRDMSSMTPPSTQQGLPAHGGQRRQEGALAQLVHVVACTAACRLCTIWAAPPAVQGNPRPIQCHAQISSEIACAHLPHARHTSPPAAGRVPPPT